MHALYKWFLNNLTAQQRIHEIEKLSHEVEKCISQKLQPIDEKGAPKEIRSLIRSINRLIIYFEDQSQNEQDFSAYASHELRTPLAGIRLQAEVAMHSNNLEIQKKAHQNILIALDKSERLIEQLLVIARTTGDKSKLKLVKINLSKVSVQAVAGLLNTAEKKNISLTMKPWRDVYILANEESILILIQNLINNAIKYTPSGGRIYVKPTSVNNKAVLSITDTGLGIMQSEYKLALQRFQKIGSSNTEPGSGLGLAIAKRICDLHNATLKFSKSDIGTGRGLKVSIFF